MDSLTNIIICSPEARIIFFYSTRSINSVSNLHSFDILYFYTWTIIYNIWSDKEMVLKNRFKGQKVMILINDKRGPLLWPSFERWPHQCILSLKWPSVIFYSSCWHLCAVWGIKCLSTITEYSCNTLEAKICKVNMGFLKVRKKCVLLA